MTILLPDLSLRQPSVTALIPLFMTYYALAVLSILPNTFFLRSLLQPVLMWQAWRCMADVDLAAWMVQSLGFKSDARLDIVNSPFAMAVFVMVLRSFDWAFIIKEPIKRYHSTKDEDETTPSKRRLSFSSVLIDAFELICNLRGIGWSWSPKSSSQQSTALHSESIPSVFATFLLNITMYDASQYLMQLICPAINNNSTGSLFDPNLSLFSRHASAAFAGICGGIWTYLLVEVLYSIATLVGRVVFRQPASNWSPVSHRPWLSTSLHEYWSVRWHQLFRHVFVTFGARPGGALLGRPGAIMGAFAISAAIHHVAVWGAGNGSEFSTAGGFFLLMGLGVVMEVGFKKATGMRVQGFSGWLWTMSWTLVWGTLMLDGWARHGIMANIVPDRFRPGKALIDAFIGLPKT